MLFSEPKISQYSVDSRVEQLFTEFQCSSASRKFLNSCVSVAFDPTRDVSVLFSEPKISQSITPPPSADDMSCFSALQRAENFSIYRARNRGQVRLKFQCSSASRKFLNYSFNRTNSRSKKVSVLFSEPKISQFELGSSTQFSAQRFSALQRAENFSIIETQPLFRYPKEVSVLFSEPKISQYLMTTMFG